MVGQSYIVLVFLELRAFDVHRGIFPSAVSQQIQAIEAHIGVRLFSRTGRKVVLTEPGERYSQLVRDEIERITMATEQMRGVKSFTLLNIRVAPTFANKWVPPRLPGFIKSTRTSSFVSMPPMPSLRKRTRQINRGNVRARLSCLVQQVFGRTF